MDPFREFARRGSETFPLVLYDPKYLYQTDTYNPEFSLSTDGNQKVYASSELLLMLEETRSAYFISTSKIDSGNDGVSRGESIVYERANPFVKVHRYVQDAENKAFELLFRFKGSKIKLRHTRREMKHAIDECLLIDSPPNNLLIAVPNAVNEVWMHFVYLLSKIYARVTLLQFMMSDIRYIVAMDFKSIPIGWTEKLKEISLFQDSRELTSLFKTVPSCFYNWYTFMNNVHLAQVIENHILNAAQKAAYDAEGVYTHMPSYAISRVANYLNGKPLVHQAIRSKETKLLKEPDEEFVRGLHLYGIPDNFAGRQLHEVLDLDKDAHIKYGRGQKTSKGGTHWGQRKLLNGEIDFFTHFTNSKDKVVVFYMGASPFDHGPILLNMFPNFTFILCDPNDRWNQDIRVAAASQNPRVFLECVFVDEIFVRDMFEKRKSDISDITNSKGEPSKYQKALEKCDTILFISDIRSTSTMEVGQVDNELNVDNDMRLQEAIAKWFSEVATTEGKKFAASVKFRLPFIMEIGGQNYEYLGGILKTQTWSRSKSTELRLWWTAKDGSATYDKVKLEDVMMYHNSVIRDASFGALDVSGYCECHDCHYELAILKRYVEKYKSSNGSDTNSIVSGYLELYNKALGLTLAAHAQRDRERPNFFTTHRVDLKTGKLRYNPLVETINSDFMFKLRAAFVSTLKAGVEFVGVSDEKLIEAFGMSALCEYMLTGQYRGSINADVVLEFTGVKISDETIVKYQALTQKYNSDNLEELRELDPKATIGVKCYKIASDSDYVKITTASSDRPVSTMAFHKKLLRRFLMGQERKYEMSMYEIKRKEVVLAKAYSFFKRLAPMYHEHLSYSLDDLFDSHPELDDCFHVGGCLLSARRLDENGSLFSDSYGAFIPDLEFGFSNNKSILQLTSLIVNEKVIVIFAPPVECIWKAFAEISMTFLKKYNNDDKAIVMIIPSKYLSLLTPELLEFEHKESRYVGVLNVFDTMKDKEVKLHDQNIVVLRTRSSNFQMTH